MLLPRPEGDDCLCFPAGIICWCVPYFLPVICSGERQANQWITRGKHGEKTGAWVIVDEEHKTLAAYGTKFCSSELCEDPQ